MKKLIIVVVLVALATSIRPFAQNINRIISKQLLEITRLSPQPVVKTIDLPGRVRLEYAEQGNAEGIPVIFLHGITDSWHSFESVLANLPSSIHAFAISQRGHGDSERPLQNYAPKDFAADIAEFIKQKKLDRVFIVGHSMGGVNAQQFAIDYPELTKGLVIIDSDPALKNNPGMPEFYQEVLKLEGAIDRKFMDDFQKATLADPIDSSYYNLLVDEGIKVPSSVFKAALEGLMQVDLTEQLKQINAPAVIFWGNKDAFCTFKGQELLVNNIKNSRLIIYGNTGHALHWEEPKKFSEDLINFIDNVVGFK
ncbi:MAG TPA: alpha/beta hydrolase [Chitinophagaceae bacterium]|jgi:pimeloyl-ACP methyl ester carboxylesterase|nr:alpha/beta hydrolase [Chitinophagaceae bacterium]